MIYSGRKYKWYILTLLLSRVNITEKAKVKDSSYEPKTNLNENKYMCHPQPRFTCFQHIGWVGCMGVGNLSLMHVNGTTH